MKKLFRLNYVLWVLLVYGLSGCNSSSTKLSENYVQLVKELTDCNYAGSGFNKKHFDNFKTALGQVTLNLLVNKVSGSVTDKQKRAEELVDKYFQGQWETDLIETLATAYQPHIDEEELTELVNQLNTNEGKKACEHQLQAKAIYEGAMVAPVMQIMMKTKDGDKETEKMDQVMAKESTLSYKESFDSYYKQLNMEEIVDGVSSILSQRLQMVGKEKVEQLLAFLKENAKVMIFNSYVDVVTEEDLNFLKSLSARPAHKALIVAATSISKDPVELSKNLITKYTQWVEKQEE